MEQPHDDDVTHAWGWLLPVNRHLGTPNTYQSLFIGNKIIIRL